MTNLLATKLPAAKLLMMCFLVLFASVHAATQEAQLHDQTASCELPPVKKTVLEWADVSRYKAENEALASVSSGVKRVVFFGSSTTDNWGRRFDSEFFPGKPYLNRGTSGETTPQMLLRFQQDVVALKPAAVVILGGTNDVAGNTGVIPLEMTEQNISSMVAIAGMNGIKVILGSQLPVIEFPWNKCLHPETNLRALSAWERQFAAARHLGYVNYYDLLLGSNGSFRAGLSPDGVHPNRKAYELMAPAVQQVIEHVLKTGS